MSSADMEKYDLKLRLSRTADPDLFRLYEVVGKKALAKMLKSALSSAFEESESFDVEDFFVSSQAAAAPADKSENCAVQMSVRISCKQGSALSFGIQAIKGSNRLSNFILKDILRLAIGTDVLLGLLDIPVLEKKSRKDVVLHIAPTPPQGAPPPVSLPVYAPPTEEKGANSVPNSSTQNFVEKSGEEKAQKQHPYQKTDDTPAAVENDDDVFAMLAAMM